jgi:predicted lipid-binding transport protein (Tim44 family)
VPRGILAGHVIFCTSQPAGSGMQLGVWLASQAKSSPWEALSLWRMVILALSGTLVGAVIGGLRFTVFALIPAIACATVIAGANWLARDGTFGSTIIGWVVFLICLQVGYLGGAALRLSIRSIRAARRAPTGGTPPKDRTSASPRAAPNHESRSTKVSAPPSATNRHNSSTSSSG